MSKESTLKILENDISDPSSYKSGEYLEELAFRDLCENMNNDREGIVGALQEWIQVKAEPRTMLAVRLAKNLGIIELIPQLQELRKEIDNGKVFLRFYLRYVDEALTVLERIKTP